MNSTPMIDETFSEGLRMALIDQATTSQEVGQSAAPTPRRRTASRFALAAVTAGAVVTGALLLQTPPSALAGWSPTPTILQGPAAQAAVQQCTQAMADFYDRSAYVGMPPAPQSWAPGLTEKRGRWTYTVLNGGNGVLGVCSGNDNGGTHGPSRSMITPAATSITVSSLGATSVAIDPSAWFNTAMEGQFSVLGRVGSEVESIVLHTSVGEVNASVQNDLWLAWWPLPDGELGLEGFATERTGLTATLTLKDGTTIKVNDLAALDVEN